MTFLNYRHRSVHSTHPSVHTSGEQSCVYTDFFFVAIDACVSLPLYRLARQISSKEHRFASAV